MVNIDDFVAAGSWIWDWTHPVYLLGALVENVLISGHEEAGHCLKHEEEIAQILLVTNVEDWILIRSFPMTTEGQHLRQFNKSQTVFSSVSITFSSL
jgi:hypothetical protein